MLPTLEECNRATVSHEYMIGDGRDRIGFHIPGSDWVYKLEKFPNSRVNALEYSHYERLKNVTLPGGIAIPEMHMLPNGVLATKYIPGKKPARCGYYEHDKLHRRDYNSCWFNIVDEFERLFGFRDSGALCNLRVVETDGKRTIYVIDLGE